MPRHLSLLGLLLASLLSACSTTHQPPPRLPEPWLSPAAMQGDVSLSQHLTLSRAPTADGVEDIHSLEAQLEIDRDSIRFAAFALGQRVLRFDWDGRGLQVERHPMLPATIEAKYVLRDIQWAYAPAEQLRQHLPEDWQLVESAQHRELRCKGRPVLLIDYSGARPWSAKVGMDNRLEGYQLLIETSL